MKQLDTINPIPICRHCVYYVTSSVGSEASGMCYKHGTNKLFNNTCDSFDPFVMSNVVRVNFGDDDDNSPVPAQGTLVKSSGLAMAYKRKKPPKK